MTEAQEAQAERLTFLPRYQCHKQVQAAKILGLGVSDDKTSQGYVLYLDVVGPVEVSKAWWDKNTPTVGQYFVQYTDGYQSVSPAKAFDEGYTLLGAAAGR